MVNPVFIWLLSILLIFHIAYSLFGFIFEQSFQRFVGNSCCVPLNEVVGGCACLINVIQTSCMQATGVKVVFRRLDLV